MTKNKDNTHFLLSTTILKTHKQIFAAMDRPSWTQDCDMNSAIRKVPELLAEQVEAADLLLVNKIDLAGESK